MSTAKSGKSASASFGRARGVPEHVERADARAERLHGGREIRAWRKREGRIFQPFEVHVAADGARTFVFCEEDWSGEGLDPVLKPRTTPFRKFLNSFSQSENRLPYFANIVIYSPLCLPYTILKQKVKTLQADERGRPF